MVNDELMYEFAPRNLNFNIETSVEEWMRLESIKERRLSLYGAIYPIDEETRNYTETSIASRLVESILMYNRKDKGIDPSRRKPILLYINSPGGDVTEGFAIVSAIETSKTPIYTVNVGQWSSMSFLIGIAGHKRFSLPYSTFLMHDGASFALGSVSKVQDKVNFDKRFEMEVVRKHVLKHSNMKNTDYDALARVELYMLPEDAMERGFIDQIVTDVDDIL